MFACGADGTLRKPFDPSRVATVRACRRLVASALLVFLVLSVVVAMVVIRVA